MTRQLAAALLGGLAFLIFVAWFIMGLEDRDRLQRMRDMEGQ